MEFIEQSYKDLNLTIIKDTIDLNKFTIIKSKELTIGNITISLYIIGESHIIKYTCNEKSFYEIFACKTLHNNKLLLSKNIAHISKESFELYNIKYNFKLSIEDTIKQKNQNDYDEYLEFTFPKGSKTAIWLKSKNNIIDIDTLHSYDNEKKYIYTTTTLGNLDELV